MTRVHLAVYAFLALACFGLGFTAGHTYAWSRQEAVIQRMKADEAKRQTAAVEAALKQDRAARKITEAVEGAASEAQERIRVVYRTITRKVPVHVTPEVDRRYPLPCGLVRLLDAAAAGVDPDQVSCGPGVADDAPSDVTASEAGAHFTRQAEDFEHNRQQVTGLQDWIRQQAAAP